MTDRSPGERLRAYRESKKKSQAKFGAPVGLTQNNISRLEHDQVGPDLTTALALQNAYGLNPDYWIYGTEPVEIELVPQNGPRLSPEAAILLEFLERNPDWWEVVMQIIRTSGLESEETLAKLRRLRDESL
jgi:transcriptional regulator with XRE-family HTH domain